MSSAPGTTAGRWSRLRPDGFTLFLLLVSLGGAALVAARAATHGAALHHDSVNYLAVAGNLLAGEGLRNWDGHVYMLWPPLYPLLLALGGLVLDPLRAAGPLNALVFGLTVFFTGRYLGRRLRSPVLRIWAPLALALSVPLGDLFWWALSEPLFILLTTLALIHADEFRRNRRTSSLVGSAVFSALAWQTRYIGFVVAAVAGLHAACTGGGSVRRRAGLLALYSGVAAAPMALWLGRNYLYLGRLTPHRPTTAEVGADVVPAFLDGLAGWAVFDPGGWTLPIAGVLAAAAWFFRDRFRRPSYGRGETDGRAAAPWSPFVLFGGFALVYAAVLVVAVSNVFVNLAQPRYLAPIYLPVLVVGVAALDHFLQRGAVGTRPRERSLAPAIRGALSPASARSLPTVLVTGALSLLTAGQIAPNLAAVGRATDPELFLDGGYNAEPWATSETLRFLRNHPVPDTVYSNLPFLVHLHTDGRSAYRLLPQRFPAADAGGTEGPRSSDARSGGEESLRGRDLLAAWLRGAVPGAFVVWFHDWDSNRLYTYGPPAMRVTPGLEPVGEFGDGAVFEVVPDFEPRSDPYRTAYEFVRSGAAGEPLAKSDFDIWFDDAALIYLREPCSTADADRRFLLHLFPSVPEGLPPHLREHGFDNRDFPFGEYGVVLDRAGPEAKCLAIVPLPTYGIEQVRTGQYRGDGPVWRTAFCLDCDRWLEQSRSLSSGEAGPPAASSVFDLFLDGTTLTYFKEPCTGEELGVRFFLHFYPRARSDLPPASRGHRFENRDFDFSEHGLVIAEPSGRPKACLAAVPIPDYEVSRFRTGQWVSGQGELWSVEVPAP